MSGPPEIEIRLVESPVELWRIVQQSDLSDGDCGAHLIFLGTTRRWTDGQEVVMLHYEAYRPMAIQQLTRLAEQAAQRWPLRRVRVIHSLGPVRLGEASIAVIASSAHRSACMEAVPWIMDQIKQCVPIWKQETAADGATRWQHPSQGMT